MFYELQQVCKFLRYAITHLPFVGNPVINFVMQSTTKSITSAAIITLTYVLMGDPLPTSDNVTWSHNGAPLDFPNSLKVSSIDNGLLISPTFTSNHEGDYTATVTSTAGSGSDSFYFNIECKFTVFLKLDLALYRVQVQCVTVNVSFFVKSFL